MFELFAPLPGFQLEVRDIGDEIGLPHEAAALRLHHLAFALEVVFLADAFREDRGIVEDEIVVVELVHHGGEIVRRNEPRLLAPGGVEMLIGDVERQREQAVRSPFEAVGLAVDLDLGAAAA